MLPSTMHPEQDIPALVEAWAELLADGRLEEACAILDEPNCDGVVWTPELITSLLNETFSPESHFYEFHPEGPVFTSPSALPRQSRGKVDAFDDGSGYWYDYDLPLNHERSDLTAQFEFSKRAGGYAVILQELHVM